MIQKDASFVCGTVSNDKHEQKQHTPMFQQYFRLKAEVADIPLLYRMGDFYEAFFDDAVIFSKLLDITLTSRGESAGQSVPMAGIPCKALDEYLPRISNAGLSVAIAEQTDSPTSTVKKGLMERKIVRIITPGTATDNILMDDKKETRIAAIYTLRKTLGVAWLTLTGNRIYVLETTPSQLLSELARIAPQEVLVTEHQLPLIQHQHNCTELPAWHFNEPAARRSLLDHFHIHDFSTFGCQDLTAAISSAGALLGYIQYTQKNSVSHIIAMECERQENYVIIDAFSRRNLEITETLRGNASPTLFSILDRCKTNMGSRFLRHSLHNPLRNINEINARLDAVTWLIEHGCRMQAGVQYQQIHTILSNTYDIERINTRIALATARPKDLANLRATLQMLPEIANMLPDIEPALLSHTRTVLVQPLQSRQLLESAITDNPPTLLKDGNVIRSGYSQALDDFRKADTDGETLLQELLTAERERTGIPTLKLERGGAHGYTFEVTNMYRCRVPEDFKRIQTLKNAERYTTPALKSLEQHILSAKENALILEQELYQDILQKLSQEVQQILDIAHMLAQLDMLCALADIALQHHYCRPVFSDSASIHIKNGRHPVIEHQVTEFIPNDISLTPTQNMILITGPNMGGKSTYMRQTALIVLLAHIGAYVPADYAELGSIDQIFTRIGASDDMSSGRSTFMVEMTETANILHHATKQSLVLIDEIGRGTSTFDGLSLAWAIAEHLATQNQALTLFATHYFELTTLPDVHPQIINKHVCALEHSNTVTFLYKVENGAASKSYGIQVAALAGVPASILRTARRKLNTLEKHASHTRIQPDLFIHTDIENTPDITLTQTAPNTSIADRYEPLIEALQSIDPDTLTPREALQTLYRIKELTP